MTNSTTPEDTFDFVIIGSGFGGSVSAMRLAEKGYRVLVLERGKRFHDDDYPKTNWNIFKFVWLPALRCFGIMQFTLLRGVLALGGSGVGGGSLVYASVLMEPSDVMFENPAWKHLADWKTILRPHYDTAKRMLGVTQNPRLWFSDETLQAIARDLGYGESFQPTQVSVFFGMPEQEGQQVPDPYFGGEGPERKGCTHCGECMIGCRHGAKNSLDKNYLYFAEKWGAEIRAECEATEIKPLLADQPDGARYQIEYQRSTAWLRKTRSSVRTRQVIVAANVFGTLNLLFHCRNISRTLPDISPRLGHVVRTNSEGFVGITSRDAKVDYSKGIAITSIFQADEVTAIEPVRYPDGSSFIRLLTAPLIDDVNRGFLTRLGKTLWEIVRHPYDFLDAKFLARWARRTLILMIMQTEDNLMRLRQGRSLLTLYRRGLVSEPDEQRPIKAEIKIGHRIARDFARKQNGILGGAFNESLLNTPTTAHIMGGVPFGRTAEEGVIGLNCEVHNYPGLYVIDGSIMPANPGINPSLTITALAEYAISQIPPKEGVEVRSLRFTEVEQITS
jgi:cholesterol oxidase